MRTSFDIFPIAIALCFFAVCLPQLYADIIKVGTTTKSDYRKIQEAIENANPGDTIFVDEGRYREHLLIQKVIFLIGSGPDKSIIDGENKLLGVIRVRYVNGGSIEKFKIVNPGPLGACISVESSTFAISQNLITSAEYDKYLKQGVSVIKNSHIRAISNTIVNFSYGVVISDESSADLVNNIIWGCSLYGLYTSQYSGKIKLRYNNFWNNNSHYGLYVTRGKKDLFEDPKFIDADVGNFRLQDDSPLVGKGHNGFEPGAFPLSLKPRTWSVSLDGKGDFVRIQDAIDASRYGDVVLVKAGEYTEATSRQATNFSNVKASLHINKGITLKGEATHLARIRGIDSGSYTNQYAIFVDDAINLTIEGFTIENTGRGVWCVGEAEVSIRKNVLRNNQYGIMGWNDAKINIDHNTIIESRIDGIYFQNQSTAVIRNNIIAYSQSKGINNYGGRDLIIAHNDFWSNKQDIVNAEPGEGNLFVEPQFVSFEKANFRLRANSPLRKAASDRTDIGAYFEKDMSKLPMLLLIGGLLLFAVLLYSYRLRLRRVPARSRAAIHCSYCGKPVDTDAEYCVYCGNKLS